MTKKNMPEALRHDIWIICEVIVESRSFGGRLFYKIDLVKWLAGTQKKNRP
jgi:hypothetical protein